MIGALLCGAYERASENMCMHLERAKKNTFDSLLKIGI